MSMNTHWKGQVPNINICHDGMIAKQAGRADICHHCIPLLSQDTQPWLCWSAASYFSCGCHIADSIQFGHESTTSQHQVYENSKSPGTYRVGNRPLALADSQLAQYVWCSQEARGVANSESNICHAGLRTTCSA